MSAKDNNLNCNIWDFVRAFSKYYRIYREQQSQGGNIFLEAPWPIFVHVKSVSFQT